MSHPRHSVAVTYLASLVNGDRTSINQSINQSIFFRVA